MTGKKSINSNTSLSSFTSNISVGSKISNTGSKAGIRSKATEKGIVIKVKKNEFNNADACPFIKADIPMNNDSLQAKGDNDNQLNKQSSFKIEEYNKAIDEQMNNGDIDYEPIL
jgi:hypothetical protein